MQPSGQVTKLFRRLTSTGVASTGKVLADFTITAYHRPTGGAVAAFTHSSTVTEISSGWYYWTYTSPTTAGNFGIDLDVATGTDYLYFSAVSGEIENQDLDSLYSSVARPIVSLTGSGTIGQITPLSLVNKRYRVLTFSFVDSTGVAIDMTTGVTYTAYTFSVRSKTDQTATPPKIDAVHGTATAAYTYSIVGASGTITVGIPEDATFFTLTEGAGTTGDDTTELRYELTGNMVSPANETIPLVQSSALTITRREGGT